MVLDLTDSVLELFQKIERLSDDIYNWSSFLYADPSQYREYQIIQTGLNDLRQRPYDSSTTYRMALILFESAQLSHQDVQTRASRQQVSNEQTIRRNYWLMYPRIQTIFDTQNESSIPEIRAELEQLYEQVDDFVPYDHSMSNVVYSSELSNQVERYANQVFSVHRSLDEDCPVCLENFTDSNNVVRFIPCGHLIHHTCLIHYQRLNRSALCPVCRSSQEWLPFNL